MTWIYTTASLGDWMLLKNSDGHLAGVRLNNSCWFGVLWGMTQRIKHDFPSLQLVEEAVTIYDEAHAC